MKNSFFPLGVLSAIALSALCLGGCSSASSQPPAPTEAERTEALRSDKSLPAPAQARVDDQIQGKQRMDAMRAQDAKKASGAP